MAIDDSFPGGSERGDIQDLPELAYELLDEDAVPGRRGVVQQHSSLHWRQGIPMVHGWTRDSLNDCGSGWMVISRSCPPEVDHAIPSQPSSLLSSK